MTSNLLTTHQAADYLGLSAAFLERDRWADKRIPFVRVGERAVRYRLSDLERYIESRSSAIGPARTREKVSRPLPNS